MLGMYEYDRTSIMSYAADTRKQITEINRAPVQRPHQSPLEQMRKRTVPTHMALPNPHLAHHFQQLDHLAHVALVQRDAIELERQRRPAFIAGPVTPRLTRFARTPELPLDELAHGLGSESGVEPA